MAVSVRTTDSHSPERRWIESVYRDYLSDLAPGATAFPVLGEIGHRTSDLLASWFYDHNAQVVTILNDEQPVGFALVRVRHPLASAAVPSHTMAEFFVARGWRRRGIGRAAVRLIFDRFAGQWHVMEDLRNTGAVQFWRRAVREYTQGVYQERAGNGEIHQYFDSSPRRPRPLLR
jgi:predicted acetyltransferase